MSNIKELYEKHFDGPSYVKFFVSEGCELGWHVEDFYHRVFTQGHVRGQNLLDVGSGPTVRAAISASAFVPEIYLSDLLERNRNIEKDWVNDEPDALDFSSQFKHVADLEGLKDYRQLEKRARNAVKEILPCDILADNPLHPRTHRQFDIVTSSYCLDCYPDDKDYSLAMKNLANLVKPGGRLVFASSYKCTIYDTGFSFPATNVDEIKLRRVMNEANLDVLEINVKDLYKSVHSDIKGVLLALAAKRGF